MICTVCGKNIPEGSKFCPECGTAAPTSKAEAHASSGQNSYNNSYNQNNYQQNGYQNNYQQPYPLYNQPYRDPYDAPNAGFLVLGLFFPFIGLILYLVMKDTSPLKAKSAGKGAIIGVCIWAGIILLSIIIVAIAAAAFAGTAAHYYW